MTKIDRDYEIADKNRDRQSGELQSFLLVWEDGEPEMKNATAENTLLYVHRMYEFLNGNQGVVLSKDPKVMLAPTGSEYSYVLNVKGHTVETTPEQAEDVLRGVKRAVEDGDLSKITDVHRKIVEEQVRKELVDALMQTFSDDERQRIERISRGWLIDGAYLVNWEASMYTKEDDPEEGDYQRGGGGVEQMDESYEFVQLRQSNSVESTTVRVNGDEYELTEREMLFLAKVKWLLHRDTYHPDKPFWLYTDREAGVTNVNDMDDDDRSSKFVPDF